jgi:Ca2+-binding RTX toxin-like protein
LDGDDTFNQPQDPDGRNNDRDLIIGGDNGECNPTADKVACGDVLNLADRTGNIEGDMDGETSCDPSTVIVSCNTDASGIDDDFSDGDEGPGSGSEEDDWNQTIESIITGSGEDELDLNDENNYADTGSGNDEIGDAFDNTDPDGGDGGNDYFAGGPGDDEVNGGDGNDVMGTVEPATAAPGDSQGDGSDLFNGGLGFDFYDASGRSASQNLTSDAFCFQDDGVFGEGDGLCWVEAILGGSGGDFIAGDNANNVLTGGAGNDNIQGLKGRDIMRGQAGDDRLSGGKGPDQLQGGAGFDTGSGGTGADTCTGVENHTSCQVV